MSIFTSDQFRNVPYNKFNLSHKYDFTHNFGSVIPIMCREALPGDKWKIAHTSLTRFAPLLAPTMQDVDTYVSDWFVPSRILSKWFDEFITGSHNGRVLPEDEVPSPAKIKLVDLWNLAPNLSAEKSLIAYFGIPKVSSSNVAVTLLPFMAYLKIIVTRFQDENLSPLDFTLLSEWLYEKNGLITSSDLQSILPGTASTNVGEVLGKFLEAPFTKAFAKDYFTSALPFAQKGGDVEIPNGIDLSHVKLTGPGEGASSDVIFKFNSGVSSGSALSTDVQVGSSDRHSISAGGFTTLRSINGSLVNEDGSDISLDAITLREFRRLNATQKFLERDGVGGTRFKEAIYSHFGVKISDGRVQDPVFLGSSKAPITIGEVVQHDSTQIGESVRAAGSLAGKGTGIGVTKPRRLYTEEWGYVLSFMYVVPKASYSQGLEKMWTRATRYDYEWPEFASIGEEPILNQELFLGNNDADNQGTFGYTPRYSYAKTAFNRIGGEFKSSLSFWTMSRRFGNLPRLNEAFIKVSGNSLYSPFAVSDTNVDHLQTEMVNQVIVKRKLPKYGTAHL